MAPPNREDIELVRAERDASPERWSTWRRDEEQAPASNKQIQEEVEGHLTGHDRRPGSQSSMSSSVRSRPESFLRVTSTQVERDLFAYLDRHPTAIQRIQDHRLQHSLTVGSTRTRSRKELPDFGGGKPYPPPLPEREEYVTEFNGHDDPEHPQNWPVKQKVIVASILIFSSFAATFASSIFSSATVQIESDFGVGQEVSTLATSLFVLGYAAGPLVWAPLSELYGRRLPTILSAFLFGIFQISVAVAKDLQTVMIGRFWSGWSGSAALTMCPAVFADIMDNKSRGLAIAIFSSTVFIGPLTAPFISGFIVANPSLGWRWTAYIPAFFGFTACVLSLLFQKESYPPVVLVNKAAELRRLSHNWGIHAKQEEVEVDFQELITKNISRPLRILFTETIVLLTTIVMAFLYGILYLSFGAYAIIFQEIHGFPLGVAGLPYMAVIVGVILGLAATVAINGSYVRKLEANNDIPVPEWRLYLPMVGTIAFTISLFWLGWTGYTNTIHWIVPSLAGIPLGFGIFCVFLHYLNYIIDAYLMFAASAVAANTLLRSVFGAVFPLWGNLMFQGIGIQWGMTFLGCVAALFIPMPFLFYKYGRRIRARSTFAPAPDIAQDKRRDEESGGSDEKKED